MHVNTIFMDIVLTCNMLMILMSEKLMSKRKEKTKQNKTKPKSHTKYYHFWCQVTI